MSFTPRRFIATVIAAGFVASMAIIPMVPVVAASGGYVGHMSVNPMASPAGKVDPNYGLFRCQVGLSTGQCYDPYQMRKAYGTDTLIAGGNDGHGKTIVIVDAFQSPNIVSQLNTYDTFYGLPGMNGLGNPTDPSLGTFTQIAPDGLTPFVPGNSNMTGWAEEISLDVEWAHAIAPRANIVLELGKDNQDSSLLSAINDAVNHNRGDVISQSFGENEACVGPGAANTAAYHQAYVNATAKGMTILASSGDQGAAQPTCDGNSWTQAASAPASDPLVTAVGGTELHAADYCLTSLGCDPTSQPAAGTYLGEIGWNEGPPYGDFQAFFGSTEASGGGYSHVWGEPSWQQGTIHGGKMRAVPDVSYNGAILHGVLTYLDIPGVAPGYYRFGGTSCGSPQWAAIIAIADQMNGRDLGFINQTLYHIGQAPPHNAAAFNDVTTGTNSAVEFDSSNNPVNVIGYNAGAGWDAVTGLGSPKVPGLIHWLLQLSPQ